MTYFVYVEYDYTRLPLFGVVVLAGGTPIDQYSQNVGCNIYLKIPLHIEECHFSAMVNRVSLVSALMGEIDHLLYHFLSLFKWKQDNFQCLLVT